MACLHKIVIDSLKHIYIFVLMSELSHIHHNSLFLANSVCLRKKHTDLRIINVGDTLTDHPYFNSASKPLTAWIAFLPTYKIQFKELVK